MTSKIEEYYNKFNENKRLKSKHGQVEFYVTMLKLMEELKGINKPKILDIGAGTGAYSIELNKLGFDVVAVELVKHNLEVLHTLNQKIEAYQGNALDLSRFGDNSFDVVMLLGPMYHLFDFEDKLKALLEAKRVVKNGGVIFVAYCMKDYAIITHAFKENHLKEDLTSHKLDESFNLHTTEEDLYSYDNLETINTLKETSGLKRKRIFSPDGPTDYMRECVKNMDDETFEKYKSYVLSISERQDLIGSGSHIVDILIK